MQQVTKKLISSEGTLDSEFKRADDSTLITSPTYNQRTNGPESKCLVSFT